MGFAMTGGVDINGKAFRISEDDMIEDEEFMTKSPGDFLHSGELYRLWRDHVGIRQRYAGRGHQQAGNPTVKEVVQDVQSSLPNLDEMASRDQNHEDTKRKLSSVLASFLCMLSSTFF
ncbi:hypothetical protein Bbelb_030400 [Branchiostoma belcheri]|nr:hypothetical protein Bbelb_030400 [Branchiostoma belcheri]